jgi:hypothetical protein
MNNLPNLPKQYKHKEADFGIELKHYFEKNFPITCSLEIKVAKNSLPFKEVKSEQIAYAKSISSDKGAWIRVQGVCGEPDYIWMRNEIAYIGIRYPKGFCLITIGNFLHEKEKNKRKSLTWERAQEIATFFKKQKNP